jgi:multiple sugar transport system permease protein
LASTARGQRSRRGRPWCPHDIPSDPFFTRTHDIAGGVDTRGVQFWFVAVRSLIAMIPPVLLALLAQRYIVRGLTLGAVKG